MSTTTPTPPTVVSYPVQLAIYDLSRGMARSLSAQFLGGPAYSIEAIPHSGLIVYGQEYFFGSGIQSESPTLFRQMTGMVPMQVLDLGRTTVSQAAFEEWCHATSRFTAQSYDLLECNCNHFAHCAALEGLALSQGVPDWVLQVPQRFLASPMGQLVRPMLDQMQLRAPVQGAHSLSTTTPYHSTTAATTTTTPNSMTRPTTLSNHATNPWASTNSTAAANPWANLSTTSSTSSTTNASSTNVASNNNTAVSTTTTTTQSTNNPAEPDHPPRLTLDSFVQPLVSNDVTTISLCFRKLTPHVSSEDDAAFLVSCQEPLQTNRPLSRPDTTRLCHILWQCLSQPQSSSGSLVLYILLVLRIVVTDPQSLLVEPCQECLGWIVHQLTNQQQQQQQQQQDKEDDNNSSHSSWSWTVVHWTVPTRALAWLVVSNAVAASFPNKHYTMGWRTKSMDPNDHKNQQQPQADTPEEALVQAAIGAMTHTDDDDKGGNTTKHKKQNNSAIRQAAAACCYNLTLQLASQQQDDTTTTTTTTTNTLSDTLVTLLCAALETVSLEPDETVQLRRLVMAGRILVPLVVVSSSSGTATAKTTITTTTRPSRPALELAHQLGLADELDQVQAVVLSSSTAAGAGEQSKESEDAATSRQLAQELRRVIIQQMEG